MRREWICLLLLLHIIPSHGQNLASNETEKSNVVSVSKPFTFSGYAQFRYRLQQDDIHNFDIRRARLVFSGKMDRSIAYRLQAEFGGTRIFLLDAELTFTLLDGLKLTAGQFKIPFSHENLQSSSNLGSINRSQTVEALAARGSDVIGNQNGRDIGLRLSGSLGRTENGAVVEYAIALVNGSGINQADRNENKDFVGRLVFHPMKPLYVGGSYYCGRYTPAESEDELLDRRRYGLECRLLFSVFALSAEYLSGRDDETERDGWYVQAICALDQGLEAVLKYDSYDADGNGKDPATVLTFGGNLAIHANSKLQINYEIKNENPNIRNNAFITHLQIQF